MVWSFYVFPRQSIIDAERQVQMLKCLPLRDGFRYMKDFK